MSTTPEPDIFDWFRRVSMGAIASHPINVNWPSPAILVTGLKGSCSLTPPEPKGVIQGMLPIPLPPPALGVLQLLSPSNHVLVAMLQDLRLKALIRNLNTSHHVMLLSEEPNELKACVTILSDEPRRFETTTNHLYCNAAPRPLSPNYIAITAALSAALVKSSPKLQKWPPLLRNWICLQNGVFLLPRQSWPPGADVTTPFGGWVTAIKLYPTASQQDPHLLVRVSDQIILTKWPHAAGAEQPTPTTKAACEAALWMASALSIIKAHPSETILYLP